MRRFKGISYYGKKGIRYLEKLGLLLPMVVPKIIVETCMGSGTFSANCTYKGTKQVAIECDKGMYVLNKCIQENVYELIKKLLEQEYSEETFNNAIKVLDECDKGVDYEEIDIAVAAYLSIIESFNSMRDRFRSFKNQESYDKFVDRLRRNILSDLIPLEKAWKGLEIIHGSLFKHPEYWLKGNSGLVFADPPYPQDGRGIDKEKEHAGYRYDWKTQNQLKFLNFVIDMNNKKEVSNIIICSILDIDDNGNLLNLEDKMYCKMLLSHGFRMVVVEKKFTSEIKNENSKSRKKRMKAEVVFINYLNILGRWNDFEYYDYTDVYGNEK